MPYRNRKSSYNNFILIFVLVKIALNLLAISHFGFQRDELLHLALADHLDWGFKEVPPVIAFLGKISTSFFGTSLFAARIFSTICGGLIVWLTGLITVELGGKMFAIALACLSIIFAPAFVASDYLFQPVVFDQLWWVLSVWLIIRYINYHSVKYIYSLGIIIGIGLLTKYTMGFFAVSLLIGTIITKQRKLLWNKHVLIASGIALLLFLPNIIWQFNHHLPFMTHMKTLQKDQLNYIKPGDFISQQLTVNGMALFLWLIGFGFLLFSFKLRKFQFMAFAFILIFLFLLEMSGKPYYLFGAYPMLFAAGGYGIERWIKTRHQVLRTAVVLFFALPNVLLLPMLLPVLPLNSTLAFFRFTGKHLSIFKFATKWEDQKIHPLTQDYADMLGWEEIVQKVSAAYHHLTPDQQKHTQIFADNYGEAAAIDHFGKQYNIPQAVSLDSSFTLWAPSDLNGDYIIYIDATNGDKMKRFAPITQDCKKISEVDDPFAREKETAILLLVKPQPALNAIYRKELANRLSQ